MRNAVFLCVVLATASAGAEDWVRGVVTVEGDSIALGHVTTFYRESAVWEDTWDLCALFSDVQVPAEAIPSNDGGFAKCRELIRADEIHALEVCFDMDEEDLVRVNDVKSYHPAIAMGRYTFQGQHVFEAKVFSSEVVEGKVSSKEPMLTSFDTEWSDEIEFSIAVPPPPEK